MWSAGFVQVPKQMQLDLTVLPGGVQHSLLGAGQAELGALCAMGDTGQARGAVRGDRAGSGEAGGGRPVLSGSQNPEWEGFLALVHFLSLIRSKFLVSLCCGLAWLVAAFRVVYGLQVR